MVKTERVEAVYEGGILRPLKKIHLKEGEKVEIIIKRSLYDIISELEKELREVDEDLTAQLVRDRK
ncbi:antitoxin family protein [Thermococcus sp.]